MLYVLETETGRHVLPVHPLCIKISMKSLMMLSAENLLFLWRVILSLRAPAEWNVLSCALKSHQSRL